MTDHRINTDRDAGGLRQYLDGRPLHAGTLIEVRLPDGNWLRGRYEWTYRSDAPALFVVNGVGTMRLDAEAVVRRSSP